ncbi:MAG: hypothetical protein H6662_09905 [Ardenticatenaceae bacterium]|nr:hypothetical protein [Anaerolineales bacterium]MCB8921888.1 hypothetical protein [Ardenticatenaceae bacterium]MCB8992204.1 hypothetical protein [Ardenticatenaceae bacterium]
MNTQKSKSNTHLRKMKMTLAAGGLMATLIGAGLLGKQVETAVTSTATTNITSTTTTTSSIDTSMPPELDLNLEAIPTVAAPTFRSMAMANGRSSG